MDEPLQTITNPIVAALLVKAFMLKQQGWTREQVQAWADSVCPCKDCVRRRGQENDNACDTRTNISDKK